MLSNITTLFINKLENCREIIFPDSPEDYLDIVSDAVHTSLNLISKSDALYHDVEHTCMVTLCGQDIFLGKKILEGQLKHQDWLHYTVALLFHDIGYVRNILREDNLENQYTGIGNKTIFLKAESTDAALTPYHVGRGKHFVRQRNWNAKIDVEFLCALISHTQFPIPDKRNGLDEKLDANQQLAELVGSADLIGQLADPHYDIKTPCLFYEFLETGAAARLGYKTPGDLRISYPRFFYNFVQPHISEAINYLSMTSDGRKWVSNLNYHVFSETNRAILEKPGIALLSEISDYVDDSDSILKVISHTLSKVCDYQGWPVGHAYKVEFEENLFVLKSTKIWSLSTSLSSISKFKDITNGYIFKPGEGLPGRVFEKQEPSWIKDVTKDKNFPRAKLANDIGVKGAFAFPIFGQNSVEYVLEFYSLNAEEPEESILSFMEQISYQIGRTLRK